MNAGQGHSSLHGCFSVGRFFLTQLVIPTFCTIFLNPSCSGSREIYESELERNWKERKKERKDK